MKHFFQCSLKLEKKRVHVKVLLKLKKGGEPVESDLCKCSEFGGINYVFCDEEVEIVQKSPQFKG